MTALRVSPAERRTAIWTLVAAVVAGVGQGLLWVETAPGVVYKVYADGTFLALPTVSANAYVSVAIYTLLGIVAGIVLAAAVWRVRSARGTATFLALTGSAAIGALVALLVGLWFRGGVDPATIGPGVEQLVTAPPVVSWLALVIEPGLAAATYTVLVAWNGVPDLGRAVPGLGTVSAAVPPAATDGVGAPEGGPVPGPTGPAPSFRPAVNRPDS